MRKSEDSWLRAAQFPLAGDGSVNVRQRLFKRRVMPQHEAGI